MAEKKLDMNVMELVVRTDSVETAIKKAVRYANTSSSHKYSEDAILRLFRLNGSNFIFKSSEDDTKAECHASGNATHLDCTICGARIHILAVKTKKKEFVTRIVYDCRKRNRSDMISAALIAQRLYKALISGKDKYSYAGYTVKLNNSGRGNKYKLTSATGSYGFTCDVNELETTIIGFISQDRTKGAMQGGV